MLADVQPEAEGAVIVAIVVMKHEQAREETVVLLGRRENTQGRKEVGNPHLSELGGGIWNQSSVPLESLH